MVHQILFLYYVFSYWLPLSAENFHEVKRLPFPDDKISFTRFKSPGIAVTESEYTRQSRCSFRGFGETKKKTARCDMELIEHQLVNDYIPAYGKVLEVGARFGTTSCAIARKVFDKGVLVSVEPDARVWTHLDHNRRSHQCSFYIVHEPVGNSSVAVGHGNYETIASYVASPTKNDSTGRPTFYAYSELESAVGFKFDTLLLDCEGCITSLFEDHGRPLREILRAVKLIIIEADNPSGPHSPCQIACVNYDEWLTNLCKIGFRVVRQIQDTKFKWIVHYVLQRL